METLASGPAWIEGVANNADSLLSILRVVDESTKILKEFDGGSVVEGFLKPVTLNPIFSDPAAHGLPPTDHHSVNFIVT